MVGFGTAALANPMQSMQYALNSGYKLFDSASYTGPWYRSEKPLGELFGQKAIRADVFITTKLHPADHGTEAMRQSFVASLRNLATDYIDLYLIHFPECGSWLTGCNGKPAGTWKDSWRVMEDLFKQKKIRAIGVSNFSLQQLRELLAFATVKPHVLQTWIDPLHQAIELRRLCKENGIVVQAYSSLGTQWLARGEKPNPVLNHPTLKALAEKYSKGEAQIVLRWLLRQGIAVLPRSNSKDHIAKNIAIFDFELQTEDVNKIKLLNRG